MHNLIAYTQQNLILFYEMEELLDRTKPNGLDTYWLNSLYNKIENLPKGTIYKNEMLLKTLNILEQANKTYNTISKVINIHPDIYQSYNFFEADLEFVETLEEQDLIYSKIQYSLGYSKFNIITTIDKNIEKIDLTPDNKDLIIQKLINNEFDFLLNIEDANINKKSLKLSNISKITEKQQEFLNELNILAETHYEIMSSLLNNHDYINTYQKNRDFIPQILSRVSNDNLIVPATNESIKAFQEIITQEKLFLTSNHGNYQSVTKNYKF